MQTIPPVSGLAVSLLTLSLALPGGGPDTRSAHPAAAGGNGATVARQPAADSLEERVDSLFAEYERAGEPGVLVGVIRDGRVIFEKGYGMADLAHGVPITPATRFNVGSISKQFTAFAFALLAERGELSLDDPAREHLPELPAFADTVRLRHMLTHTSGYREAYGTLALAGRSAGRDRLPREETLEVIRRQPALEFEPGTWWQYNSTAYVVLARILERVTGEGFPAWTRENVFAPLGMDSTVIESEVGQVVPGAAYSYAEADDGEWRLQTSNRAIYGSAEVYTTVGDLAKWIENLETAELGGPAVRERMVERYVLSSGDTTTYALGLGVDEHRGLRWIEHGGSHAGYRAQLSWYPELDAGVVLMSNRDDFSAERRGVEVAEIFFGDRMEPEPDPVAVGSARLDRYAGRYRAPNGDIYAFEHREGELFPAGSDRPLAALSDSTFWGGTGSGRVTFHPAPDGSVDRATYRNRMTVPLRRIEPWEPEAGELAPFAGRYVSPELGAVYTLRASGGRLLARSRWHGEWRLEPLEEDAFEVEGGGVRLEFERNDVGIVTGFYASVGDGTHDVWFGRRD